MRALAQNRILRTSAALATSKTLASTRSLVAADYLTRVKATRASSLVAYWPLDEAAGAVAFGQMAGRNGATTGATVGQAGIGDGRTSYGFDTVNDYVNVMPSGSTFPTAFNGVSGSLAVWLKFSGNWADATIYRAYEFQVDANNRVALSKNGTNTLVAAYLAGGTNSSILKTSFSPSTFFHLAMTWDKATLNQVALYINGTQQGTSVPGTFSTSPLTITVLGASSTVPANVWNGNIAHMALWNKALTAAEIFELSLVLP